MTLSQYPVKPQAKPAPSLTPAQRAMIAKAVKHELAMIDVRKAVQKAMVPVLDKATIEHFCSTQTLGRLGEIVSLWTDQMVINLTRGAVLSALEREGGRRFASGQRPTSELAILREAASAELAKRSKAR